MNFIIEAHRKQDSVNPVKYAVLLDNFVAGNTSSTFDVYTTVNELVKRNKIDTVNEVTFKGIDIDTKFDTYYVSLDVPDDYKSAMNEGRGAFIADIEDEKIVQLNYVQKGGQ